MKIAIVGGGMAGCALAYVLKQAGEEPVIYEAGPSLANGASGNSVGLYNPRFSAFRSSESDYYTSAFSLVLKTFEQLNDINWNPCGALHLTYNEKKEKQFAQTVQNWGWEPEHMRLVDCAEASALAGIDLDYGALYLPQSGCVSPKRLCEAYARGVDVHLNASIETLDDLEADVVILAAGPAVNMFVPDLSLGVVRGQITEVQASELSRDVQTSICYGGYLSPSYDGVHIVGATFQRWIEHSNIIEQDDADNIEKLGEVIPGVVQGLKIVGQRASVRATSRDYFPVVGQVSDKLYVSAAHGSHGIVSSLMAAHLLSDMILGRTFCLPSDVVQALSPQRRALVSN